MKKIITTIMVLSLIFSFSVSYAAEMQFSDVSTDSWYYSNLDTLYQKEIAGGYPDGTFRPDNTLKFEEFLKMLIVATDGQKDQAEGQEWYQGYIDFAIKSKYMTDGQRELIGQNIDRKTASEIIYNMLTENEEIKQYTEAELEYLANQFSDLTTEDANTLAVIGAGIISGYPDKTFKPANTLKRSESVAVISRVINPTLRSPITITADMLPDTRTFDELPPVDLSHLYEVPFALGKSIQEMNAMYDMYGGESMKLQNTEEITAVMELLHNRNYETIKDNAELYKEQLLYYLNGRKEYKGVYYNRLCSESLKNAGTDQEMIDWVNEQTEYFECYVDRLVNDTVNDKIQVQAKFYTSSDLAMSHTGARGILRFKYDGHLHPENIKQELDLVEMQKQQDYFIMSYMDIYGSYEEIKKRIESTYLNFNELPEIEIGKWYEMELDVVATQQSAIHGIKMNGMDANKANINYRLIYPISVKTIEQE